MDQMSIWHCIPKKLEEAIERVEYRANVEEGDSKYWIYLDDGWVAYDGAPDCRTIHTNTLKDLRAAIKTIRRG